MLMANHLNGFGVLLGGGPVTGGVVAFGTANRSGGTATFTAFGIGAAAADRLVIVIVTFENTLGGLITAVTIGGNAATLVGELVLNNAQVAMYKLAVASGTTADIIVSLSNGGTNTCGLSSYAIYGANHAETDYDETSGSGVSISLSTVTVPSGGIGIWGFINVTNNTAVTWTGATEDFDNSATQHRHSVASTKVAGTPTVTADGATADQVLIGAAWGTA